MYDLKSWRYGRRHIILIEFLDHAEARQCGIMNNKTKHNVIKMITSKIPNVVEKIMKQNMMQTEDAWRNIGTSNDPVEENRVQTD